jgi:hypothetical protein
MSSPDPTKVLYSARYKYFINIDDAVESSVSIPAASRTAGSATDFTITLPKSADCRYANVKLNFSTDTAGVWHLMPATDFTLDANFGIANRIAYLTNSVVIHLFLFNNDGVSAHTNTAVTVTARIRPQSVS